VLNNNLFEFNTICELLYNLGDLGVLSTILLKGIVAFSPLLDINAVATSIGICCLDVKYNEDGSALMSSVIGINPSELPEAGCPFFNIIIGSPSFPELDQLFLISPSVLAVAPNRILLPFLPSMTLSPEKGKTGCIFPFSIN